jgi:hypothetical protein
MKALAKACLAILVLALASSAMAAPEKLAFKSVKMAVLKMDGRPAKIWNVFVAPDQQHRVLLQLGSRYLMLNTNEREVLEVPADSLRVQGRDIVWMRSAPPATEKEKKPEADAAATKPAATGEVKEEKLVASTDWSIREVGPARMIRLRLTAEGRQIEVQLPIQPDLRILY